MSTIHVQPTDEDRRRLDVIRVHLAGRNGRPATTAAAVRYALRVAYRRLRRQEKRSVEIEERAGG